MRVMGYFCVGANTYWAQQHPDLSYGADSNIHIPFTSEYLDYLSASIQDVLRKTGIDGFMIDWVFSPPTLMKETRVRWLACEQRMYAELYGRPFPARRRSPPTMSWTSNVGPWIAAGSGFTSPPSRSTRSALSG